MTKPYNGMPASDLTSMTWQKSQFSNPSGNCVEIARLPDDRGIAVRNSRFPDGPTLIYTFDEVSAFLQGAKHGEFDGLVTVS